MLLGWIGLYTWHSPPYYCFLLLGGLVRVNSFFHVPTQVKKHHQTIYIVYVNLDVVIRFLIAHAMIDRER